MIYRFITGFLIVFCFYSIHAQEEKKEINPNGFNVFYYPNGVKSSEGHFKNGKPDGEWKNYYLNGELKSIGRRENNKLTGKWEFYNDEGILTSEIEYKKDLKQGVEKNYSKEGFIVSVEYYDTNKLNGPAWYYKEENLQRKVFYKDGINHGPGYKYGKSGEVIMMFDYFEGRLQNREGINRKTKQGEKVGKWVEFFPCKEPCMEPYRIRLEGRYVNGKKHGYFSLYDYEGNLLDKTRYVNGEVAKEADLEQVEIRKEYHENAKVKFERSFKDDELQGVSREYDKEGKLINCQMYDEGVLLGEGILNERGLKEGPWKEYYPTGELRAEGEYWEGLRIGVWKFYHRNGQLEQKGKYLKFEKPTGQWKWWYPNGDLKRLESFYGGKEDGELIEYNDSGDVVTKGEYLEGLKEGFWFYDVGDYREEGEFVAGEKQGVWKHYYKNTDNISFIGEYMDGIPVGKHIYYHPNGKKKLEGRYEGGLKEGPWKRYDPYGLLMLTIKYADGFEKKLDGKRIRPKLDYE